MRKLIESTFMTLNGAIDNPQHWSPPYWDDEHAAYTQALMEDVEAQVLGRVTYEGFAEAWSQRGGDPFTDNFNAMPKYVASRTLTEMDLERPAAARATPPRRSAGSRQEDGGDLIKYGTGDVLEDPAGEQAGRRVPLLDLPGAGRRRQHVRRLGIDITHLDLLGSTTFKSGIVVHKLAPKA